LPLTKLPETLRVVERWVSSEIFKLLNQLVVEYRFIADPILDQKKSRSDSSCLEPVVLEVSLHDPRVFFIG
jgi:hypothetical protein